ncbi:MAG: succinate dehydrogenase, hydrophobic membrane anchor protein [Steroidobacteraceae bacterium]|nr:succinate dehydrogenase, hydrophobic membrane anchor protein [Steroidobacteraceae bacterium]
MSLRSPLRRVTYLGSAKGGSSHWYAQRVTAVALVLLGAWLVFALATMGGASHEHVVAWLSSPVAAALAVLLVLTAAWHALLGLQVVIEDYVGEKGTRTAALLAVQFALAVAAVIGVLSVLRIAFGVAG